MMNWFLFYLKHVQCPVVVNAEDITQIDVLSGISSSSGAVEYTMIPVRGRYIDLPFPHFVFYAKRFRYVVGYSESLEETWG